MTDETTEVTARHPYGEGFLLKYELPGGGAMFASREEPGILEEKPRRGSVFDSRTLADRRAEDMVRIQAFSLHILEHIGDGNAAVGAEVLRSPKVVPCRIVIEELEVPVGTCPECREPGQGTAEARHSRGCSVGRSNLDRRPV